ncbi:DUF1190 domain-containing protein [uncultured Tateyamaria sp.]|uniref:DUF1190 domain-containing protein n=1 Tax=uncultured Tateyamaria sp. TaxID=455651 RepID=UPI00263696F2|nr:DUF1190 domain-containing protein [uncultured Tateyamaria sp.]
MKRSRSVTLLTMASATFALAACEEQVDTEGELYKSEAECSASEFVPEADCAPLLTEGTRIHKATAPRYNTMNLCEAEHGRSECVPHPGGPQTYYSPSPLGYLVTGAIAGGVVSDLVRPVYRERDSRRYYTTGGGFVRYMDNGRYGTTRSTIQSYNPTITQAPPRIQTRTTIASRSGFGSRSGSLGS